MLLRLQSLSSQRGTLKPYRRFSPYLASRSLFLLFTLCSIGGQAQFRQEPGKPIGKVSVLGNAIVLELDENVLGKANIFDLDHHTLRFTPTASGYKIENLALQWDSDFGDEITGAGAVVSLKNFKFPF